MAVHSGKVALVTGGASGIGKACVERFHADGAQVGIGDVDLAAAQALATALGSGAVAFSMDVTDEASVQAGVDRVVAEFGRLDFMINNAGIGRISELVDTSFDAWRRTIDINVNGVFLGCRAAAKQMIAQGEGGVIVNASSGAARRGFAGLSHYCASKAAVVLMSQSFARELAVHKIRVNCYQPGHIQTPIWDGLADSMGRGKEDVQAELLPTIPWGRFGRPEEIAGVASWLCSDEAEYITGESIAINGGEDMT